jgi:hypothetical protein
MLSYRMHKYGGCIAYDGSKGRVFHERGQCQEKGEESGRERWDSIAVLDVSRLVRVVYVYVD